jgi:hypothetical protein
MALTVATVESILMTRLSPLLTAAGMDATDLDDAMGWAIRQASGTVTTWTTVVDADVATVPDDNMDYMLDLAEYRTLVDILGNLDDVNVTSGPYKEELSQLAAQVEKLIDRMLSRLGQLYGWPKKQASIGTITLSFAEHDDDSPEV